VTKRLLLPNQPVTAKGDLPSRDLVEIIQRLVAVAGSGGGGLADGNYGDVTVSGGGTVITINSGAITTAEIAGFAEGVDDRVAALLVAGSNITLTYNDPANTLTIAAAGATSGLATVTVPNNALEWSQTVTAVGVTAAQRIMLTVGAHVDADENTAEMLDIDTMSATAGTGQITVEMAFATPQAGAIKLNWMAV
jgi:hypothetical protein